MEKSLKNGNVPKNESHAINLKDFLGRSKPSHLKKRVLPFYQFIQHLRAQNQLHYHRLVTSAAGKRVIVNDPASGKERAFLMFASNNYLGLANDPYVKSRVKDAIDQYGIGVGGPPLLNGYTKLMRDTEMRLADLKHKEDAIIFSSGYSTNLGLLHGLIRKGDLLLYDELSHASFLDGIKLSGAEAVPFKHNRTEHLEELLKKFRKTTPGQLYVGVEGIYSMDGDVAPLDTIVALARKHDALIILDDAHGTGVMGANGSGTAEYFNVEDEIDISMGTFSKAFAVTGGFLAGSKEIINYIRYFARSYMFSAALPPTTLAAVLAGIDIIEREPERRTRLHKLADYARWKLKDYTLYAYPEAAIIALCIPEWMDIRKANASLFDRGIFLNAIEYPAVAQNQQRFRISLTTEHTETDIDNLAAALAEVWQESTVTV